MIRRAMIPSLFALSFGELILSLFPGTLFAQPEYPDLSADRFALMRIVEPSMAFLGAILALTVAIAIYGPTWLLNDAGIVSHLKQDELTIRRPPDIEGVGKWFGGFISGFALLTYPITVIYKYVFFLPSMFAGVTAFNYGFYLLESLLWIVGLPLLTMTYVLPVVMINEVLLPRTAGVIQGIARRLGASDITQEVAISGPLEFDAQS